MGEHNLDDREKDDIRYAYNLIMDELNVAQEAYSEAAVRVTRLTAAADRLRSVLDS